MKSEIYNLFLKKNNKPGIKNSTAIIFEDKRISYEEIIYLTDVLSNSLLKKKNYLKKEIIVALENSEKYIILLLAASKLNLSLQLLNPDEVDKNIERFENNLIIVDKKKFALLKNNKNLITIEKLFNMNFKHKEKINNFYKKNYIINFSSGSTGVPKKIIFTQQTKIKRVKQFKQNLISNKKNIIISYAPIHHSLGQRLVFVSLLNSDAIILMRRFNFNEWKKNINKYKATMLFPISSHLRLLINSLSKEKHLFTSVKKILASSSQAPQDIKNIIMKKYKNLFYEAYGAAELAFVSILRPSDNNFYKNSVGKLVDGVSVKILKKNKKQKYGEICGYSQCLGKFSAEEKKNKDIFYKEKFFRTGDYGFVDRKKYLYFISRIKDIIIKSGLNISPKIIEDEIIKHKIIKNCIVIGVKDELFGESPIAICQINKKNKNKTDIVEKKISTNLNKYEIPAKYIYVNSIKFLSNGKVDKLFYKKKYSNLILNKNMTKLFV